MRAEIIAIGNEILQGRTLDTNSHWLAGVLLETGVDVRHIRVISDKRDAILEALATAEARSMLVIITGGLGPTSDDITKKTLADYFNDELVLDESVLEDIKQFLERRGKSEINALNRSQAEVPSRCEVLRNRVGTAPGMWFEKEGIVFVSTPGVPLEMKEIMTRHVLPKLGQTVELPAVVQRTALTHGIPEAELARRLESWERTLGDEILLAYLPTPGVVKVRLTARGKDRERLTALVEEKMETLRREVGDDIFGYDDQSLEEVVGDMLATRNATVATAESCTGGTIAARLTSVPGASRYYLGSIVSYANEVKCEQLGVDPKILEAKGAVSREVVEQMARGVRDKMKADFSVAVSGIAGPDGGTEEKPVGTVWIAAASKEKTVSKRFQFGERRETNIDKSAHAALDMLRRLIKETDPEG
jgi:nicotinamide-nucleotide amidase